MNILKLKKLLQGFTSIVLSITFIFSTVVSSSMVSAASEFAYLEDMQKVGEDGFDTLRGTKSFVEKIGTHPNTQGNIDTSGKKHAHGIEIYMDRMSRAGSQSWAWGTYELNTEYAELSGRCVLLDFRNRSTFKTTLSFYGDDKLLETIKMTSASVPFDFKINIKGVKRLKIAAEDIGEIMGGSTAFLLSECKLSTSTTKTETKVTYDSKAPKKPEIHKVNKKTGLIIGKATKSVKVYVKISKKTYTCKSRKSGEFSIKTKKLKPKTVIKIWAVNAKKQKSKVRKYTVK